VLPVHVGPSQREDLRGAAKPTEACEREDQLPLDLGAGEAVDRTHFDQKPLYFRAAARIARLASPIL